MKLLTYQLIGAVNYERVMFDIEGSQYGPHQVSSAAVAEHFISRKMVDDAVVKLIAPLSLQKPASTDVSVERLRQNFRNFINERIRFEGGFSWDVLLIPAIGTYASDSETWTYESTPRTVATQVLVEMLNDVKVIGNDGAMVVVDVSTGWNGYIPPILDALRALMIIDKIEGGLKSRRIEQAMYVVSEPVYRPVSKQVYKVYFVDFQVKASMNLPINKRRDADNAGNISNYFHSLTYTEKREINEGFKRSADLKKLLS
ncbi:MAG: hypothetical protein NZ581_08275 [Candidatus Caldarchaeum sp.]|nr:hypothetical protein [Candidatus Caldarchaeum sp.]MDW8436169.1 hypothetical protein [Candidatus Caldarchaeum sp.]